MHSEYLISTFFRNFSRCFLETCTYILWNLLFLPISSYWAWFPFNFSHGLQFCTQIFKIFLEFFQILSENSHKFAEWPFSISVYSQNMVWTWINRSKYCEIDDTFLISYVDVAIIDIRDLRFWSQHKNKNSKTILNYIIKHPVGQKLPSFTGIPSAVPRIPDKVINFQRNIT